MALAKFCYLDMEQDHLVQQEEEDDKKKPISDSFYLQFQTNYVVQFPPHYHQLNIWSRKESLYIERSRLTDESRVCDLMSRVLSSTPIQPQDLNSIIKIIFSKARLLDADPKNAGRSVIPVVMSLRLVFVQDYNAKLNQLWKSTLGLPLAVLFKYPATRTAVRGLDKVVVVDKGSCSTDECPICCQEFSVGDEVTRLPCFHRYHGDCIAKWLEESCWCPSCRFPLPVHHIPDTLYPFKTKRVLQASSRKRPRMSVSNRVQIFSF